MCVYIIVQLFEMGKTRSSVVSSWWLELAFFYSFFFFSLFLSWFAYLYVKVYD